VAIIKFLHWLDHQAKTHSLHRLNEISISEKLLAFRQEDLDFEGPSFSTIAGFAEHSAVIHYHATEKTAKSLSDQALFLLDSGGQYRQGTTDITRVFHFGTPTAQQKKYYTLVLKGHLALARACFVSGTTGMHLDTLARQFLWAEGLDFLHGTGHGVGCNLCVHEGPQRISPAFNTQALLPGMVVSNEPGVYLPNQWGIRIENLCFVKEKQASDCFNIGVGPFFEFEDLTLVPYALNLIQWDILTPEETQQIQQYHGRILTQLEKHLTPEVFAWLKKNLG